MVKQKDIPGHYAILMQNISYKAKHGIMDLTDDEKELIFERLVDDFQVSTWHLPDEKLMEMAIDRGLVE